MDPTPTPPPRHLEEDDGQAQEVKDLLSSLPKEKGWITSPLYQYQGFWYGKRQLLATLACQKHFQAHDTDIFLITTPKSGTTWLKAMAFTIVNRDRFPYTSHPLRTHNPHELVPFLDTDLYVDNKLPDLTHTVPPRIFASHLPYISLPESAITSKCKIVHLCRDPKDAFISYWHFANKVSPANPFSLEEAFEMFCKGVTLCGPFWDHVLEYWKKSFENPERVFFLKYEDIKGEPQLHFKRLAEFLGYPFTSKEEKDGVLDEVVKLCSFENLSNLEVNKTGKIPARVASNASYFRSGKVGDSKNYLTPEEIERMDQIVKDKLHGSGLKF